MIRFHYIILILGSAIFLLTGTLCYSQNYSGNNLKFEVSASTYAWELADESPAVVLDNLQKMAGINSAYLIALMHGGRRPKGINRYPHDPVRDNWQAEDACIYWKPDLSLYGRLKPAVSSFEYLNSKDWLSIFIEESRMRNLKTGAEISHYIIPKDVLRRPENKDLCQRSLAGDTIFVLCPNNPDGREYILALFRDLAKNYNLDFIQTCYLPLFDTKGFTDRATTCCCSNCVKKAAESGFDLQAAIELLRNDPTSEPAASDFTRFHKETLRNLMKDIFIAVRSVNYKVELRYNHHNPLMDWGRVTNEITSFVNSFRVSAYQEESNSIEEIRKVKIPWIKTVMEVSGGKVPVLAAVAVRPGATDTLIRESVSVLTHIGINGVSLGHYESAPFSYLRAVNNGLADAEKPGFNVLNGIEAENMIIEGCSREKFISEECIKFSKGGSAKHNFIGKPGKYDLYINYAGLNSAFSFSVNEKEICRWESASENGCWMRKDIPRINLKKGDKLILRSISEEGVEAYADFLSIRNSE